MIRAAVLLFALLSMPAALNAQESEECLAARRAASFAATTCDIAKGQCKESCQPARDAAVSACDTKLSSDRKWCEENQPEFLAPCQTQALERHSSCISAARGITTCTTESCTAASTNCADADLKAAQAVVTCRK